MTALRDEVTRITGEFHKAMNECIASREKIASLEKHLKSAWGAVAWEQEQVARRDSAIAKLEKRHTALRTLRTNLLRGAFDESPFKAELEIILND